jgi:hypothetical protein
MHVNPVLHMQATSPSADNGIKIQSSTYQCILPAQATGHQLLLLRESQVATEPLRAAEVAVPLIPAHPLLLLLLLLLLLDHFSLHTSQIVSPDIVCTSRRAGPARARTAPVGHAWLAHVPAAVVVLRKRVLEGIDVGRNGELTHVVDALGGIGELMRNCVCDEGRGGVDTGADAGAGARARIGLLDVVVWLLVVFVVVVLLLAARLASTKPGLPGRPGG